MPLRSLAALSIAVVAVLALMLLLFWATGLLRVVGMGAGLGLAATILVASGVGSVVVAQLLFGGQAGRAERRQRAQKAAAQRIIDAGTR